MSLGYFFLQDELAVRASVDSLLLCLLFSDLLLINIGLFFVGLREEALVLSQHARKGTLAGDGAVFESYHEVSNNGHQSDVVSLYNCKQIDHVLIVVATDHEDHCPIFYEVALETFVHDPLGGVYIQCGKHLDHE